MPVLVTTAYHPPAWYIAEAMRADEMIIEAFETYVKQTCRNHCTIFGPNGRQTLSVPVVKANGNHTLTKDILVSSHQPWQKIHWRSIETAYNNSPFFLFYRDHFSGIYEKKFRFLLDLNNEIFTVLAQILKITCKVRISESYQRSPSGATDLRDRTGLKDHGMQEALPHYTQVFEPRHGFIPGLSILDVIFNLGPESTLYLASAFSI